MNNKAENHRRFKKKKKSLIKFKQEEFNTEFQIYGSSKVKDIKHHKTVICKSI